MTTLRTGLAEVADEHARVLILGTMPGEESLRRQEYYAHPRNRFWKLIAEVFNEALPSTYEERKALLFKHHIAIWDVARTAIRAGSLDSAMSDEIPNDLNSFLDSHKKIELVCFNGKKSAALHDTYFRGKHTVRYTILPSTSPANAAIGWTELLTQWRVIKL